MVEMLGLKKPLPTEIIDKARSMMVIVRLLRSPPNSIAPLGSRFASWPWSSSEIEPSSLPRIWSFLPWSTT